MKVVIIGAIAAGSKAAAKLNRLRPDWEIVIYSQEKNISYSECGMPYYIAGYISDISNLIMRTPREFRKKGIGVNICHRVLNINPNKKELLVKNLTKNEIFTTNYDKLIIATGATPYVLYFENCSLENIFTLRTLEDGVAVKNAVLQSNSAVILGGGYIGIEVLEAMVQQKLNVTLINSHDYIMQGFDKDMSELIQKQIYMKSLESVKILNNDTIVSCQGNKKVEKVITKNGHEIKADMVLIAAGIVPNVELAQNAGVEIGKTGAIKVNSRMQTNIKDIYACGDCVEKKHIVADAPCWIPLGSTANKEGRCCAINVAGFDDEFDGVLGSAVTKYFNYTMSLTGLNEKKAVSYGFNPISVVVKKNDKAGYMPDVQTIVIKLIADKDSHRILGAQGLGLGEVDKRINALTSALLSKMTIEEFYDDDITYAPPFSTSIDPMLTATQNLLHKLSSL
ncbi:MAG: FAD-dependent oxidoreductase [Candidatus Gastranaerophilaceae bacterium]